MVIAISIYLLSVLICLLPGKYLSMDYWETEKLFLLKFGFIPVLNSGISVLIFIFGIVGGIGEVAGMVGKKFKLWKKFKIWYGLEAPPVQRRQPSVQRVCQRDSQGNVYYWNGNAWVRESGSGTPIRKLP